jgi:hypothetical protein
MFETANRMVPFGNRQATFAALRRPKMSLFIGPKWIKPRRYYSETEI